MDHQHSAHQLALLTTLQKESFDYFIHQVNPANGLIRDKTDPAAPASIAAVGMALTIYPIGVERGFMTRRAARDVTLTTLRFFADSEQGTGLETTGYKGFYYHFLDMQTGRRAWNCELSSIDTALLIAGILAAAQYFDGDDADERTIAELADQLYRRVDWQWMLAGGSLLCHGYKPKSGFMKWRWEGYDESLILQLLALGSPTFPIDRASYAAWTASFAWKTAYGIDYLYAGPLFIHQMSHLWVDFRGVRDDFITARDSDYFENSRRATLVQQRYAIDNPMKFNHYSALCWGFTASDGPGDVVVKIDGVERRFFDYAARGAPYGPDDGTVAPWVAAASLPFAPDIVLPTIEYFHRLPLCEVDPYGFKASFSATWKGSAGQALGWVSPYHFGINEGPTVIMIDNYLHGFTWQRMRANPYLRAGLMRAGFRGGWLTGEVAHESAPAPTQPEQRESHAYQS
jgi:hypothetical protein